MFSGQGAQYVGMGGELVEASKAAEEVFQLASQSLGWDVAQLCFEGPSDKLNLTEFTQPALLTVSVAVWETLRQYDIPQPHRAAGLSLGEYSALVAAGVLRLEDACVLVNKRGRFMQEAVPEGVGGMAAVIGMEEDEVRQTCREVEENEDGVVRGANYNCPGQVVITGHNHLVEKACEVLREGGARRVIPLEVSAPFHSPLMQPAAEKLAEVIADIEFGKAEFPVVANINAEEVTQPEEIKEALLKQVYSPVLWEKSVHTMMDAGCETFVEVGTGDTLSGFLRRISRQVNNYRCEKPEEIEEVAPQL